jgi:hypothetical protein
MNAAASFKCTRNSGAVIDITDHEFDIRTKLAPCLLSVAHQRAHVKSIVAQMPRDNLTK